MSALLHGVRRPRLALLASGVAFAAALGVGASGRVAAHTDVDFTVPAADEVVATPVDTIVVAFQDPVSVVGAGFEVFTPDERIVQPPFSTDDGRVFTLALDPPLAGGLVGVRYEVVAEDGHLIDGSWSFEVTAAPVTTPPPTEPPPTAPPATATASTPPATPTPTPPAPAATAPAATESVVPVTTSGAATDESAAGPSPGDSGGPSSDGGGGTTVLVVAVAVAIAVAAGALLLIRSRAGRTT
jgi:methionine-rich copper-binding protein CopC